MSPTIDSRGIALDVASTQGARNAIFGTQQGVARRRSVVPQEDALNHARRSLNKRGTWGGRSLGICVLEAVTTVGYSVPPSVLFSVVMLQSIFARATVCMPPGRDGSAVSRKRADAHRRRHHFTRGGALGSGFRTALGDEERAR